MQTNKQIADIRSLINRMDKHLTQEEADKAREIELRNENLRAKKGLKPLNEAGINRILSHGESGFIIISSHRGSISSGEWDEPICDLTSEFEEAKKNNPNISESEWLAKRNQSADKELQSDIISQNLSFTKVYGGYKEDSGDVVESSYIVFAKDRKGNDVPAEKLFELGKRWSEKYHQDSFLFKSKGEAPNYYNYKGEQKNSSSTNKTEINKDSAYFTTNKRSKNPKKFAFDINFESKFVQATTTIDGKAVLSPQTKQIMESQGYFFV